MSAKHPKPLLPSFLDEEEVQTVITKKTKDEGALKQIEEELIDPSKTPKNEEEDPNEDNEDNKSLKDTENESKDDDHEEYSNNPRRERLMKLKKKLLQADLISKNEVSEEFTRLETDDIEKKQKREEWYRQHQQKLKDLKAKGIDEEHSYLMESVASAEKRESKKEQKEMNRINNFGWNIFNQDALYRAYNKQVSKLPKKSVSDLSTKDSLDYGDNSKIDPEKAEMVANYYKEKDEKSKENFSKRKTFYNEEEVNYINERNRVFNKRLSRYYDKYTADMRANIERGSAL
ncbi:hypothetical protein WA158_002309 [Blastocystis sp. Blastoise]